MKKLLLLVFMGLPFFSWAQDEATSVCVQNIELAQQRYDEGRIQDIQALLKACIDGGTYDKAQKSQALRLLALSYLFLEDKENAEATMLQLISANHEFQVNPAIDPTEFINLHEQFRYKPLFNTGVRYIANMSTPIVSGLNSTLSLTDSRPEYAYQFGIFGIGVNFEYEFFKDFFIYPEIQYRSQAIERTEMKSGDVYKTVDYMKIVNYEKQSWISLPVSAKYLFHMENTPSLKFYVNAGGSIDFLAKATRTSNQAILEQEGAEVVGFTYDTQMDKNRLNFGVFGGGGVMVKAGEGFISLEARYVHSLTQLTKPENILNPTNARQTNTGVQDDIYRLNFVAISLGYTLNIYLPKQLR